MAVDTSLLQEGTRATASQKIQLAARIVVSSQVLFVEPKVTLRVRKRQELEADTWDRCFVGGGC